MSQRPVRDLMRIRHGHVVQESATLREVAERLIISDCDVMAVTDGQAQLVGVVCESSVVRALLTNPPEKATIQSIIIRHAESVRRDAPLSSVLPLFRTSAHTAIPVVDSTGCVCGLLMRRDVIGNLLNRRVDSAEPVVADSPAATAAPAANPVAFRLPRSVKGHSAADPGETNSGQPGPHFLRADAARQLLWAAEDRL